MKVSYNWIQDYFKEPLPTLEELGELLTFHSYELEGIEEVQGDHVIEVDILPNRSSDSLSHRGIAREIATLLNREMVHEPLGSEPLEVDESEKVEVEVEDQNLCSRYALTLIEGVKVGKSPDWLKKKLETLGQRSINNVVDATNFVMLNLGQPLHAFDAKKLKGEKKKIVVRNAKQGEKITTLTGDEYELDSETLLITDGNSNEPIGIAGVKGGKVAEVDANTTDIVIESAHFNFANIRKTSKRLKLWTDASMRFQNNPSQHLVGYALKDVTELILDIAGGSLEGGVDVVEVEPDKEQVFVTVTQINNLLGTKLKEDDVVRILEQLDFEYEQNGESFVVTPPFERMDITIYEDVIEEIGRVYGYEHLEARALPELASKTEINKEFYYADRIRNILVEVGFSEIIGYTFRSKGDYEVVTALASDKAFLRTNLQDGMREFLDKNHRNAPLFGLDRIKLFEIGSVFPKTGEVKKIALGISGKKVDALLAEAKALLEEKLGVTISEVQKDGVLEFDFDTLLPTLNEVEAYEQFEQNLTPFKPFSLFPFMLRDIALWVPIGVSENDIAEIIKRNATELLQSVAMFDEFQKEDKTSYAFHLVFQSDELTLTDDEINKVMETITIRLNAQEGFEVR